MKREIIFRGKDVETGEWVEGYYVLFPTPCIYNPKTGEWHKAHPETVGQYTGLKDVNDKAIFEGDILSNKNGDVLHLVSFIEEDARFAGILPGLKDTNGRPLDSGLHQWWITKYGKKVIGNVIDNPEMLPCENKWKEF